MDQLAKVEDCSKKQKNKQNSENKRESRKDESLTVFRTLMFLSGCNSGNLDDGRFETTITRL